MGKDFKAALEEHAEGYEPTEDNLLRFTINSDETRPYFAYVPTEDQIGLYAAAFGDDAKDINVMSETKNFLRAVLDKPTYDELLDRVRDRNDPVTIVTLQGILEWLFEEFSGFPTKPSSGSSSSQRPGGERLTDHLPPRGSTRSPSRPAGSRTSSTRGQ